MYPSRKKKKSPPRSYFKNGNLIHRGNQHLFTQSYLKKRLKKSIENYRKQENKSSPTQLKVNKTGRNLFKRPTTSPVTSKKFNYFITRKSALELTQKYSKQFKPSQEAKDF